MALVASMAVALPVAIDEIPVQIVTAESAPAEPAVVATKEAPKPVEQIVAIDVPAEEPKAKVEEPKVVQEVKPVEEIPKESEKAAVVAVEEPKPVAEEPEAVAEPAPAATQPEKPAAAAASEEEDELSEEVTKEAKPEEKKKAAEDSKDLETESSVWGGWNSHSVGWPIATTYHQSGWAHPHTYSSHYYVPTAAHYNSYWPSAGYVSNGWW